VIIVLALVTVTVMVFSVVWGNSKIQSKKEILVPRAALILTR
jgi:hypothetical protein